MYNYHQRLSSFDDSDNNSNRMDPLKICAAQFPFECWNVRKIERRKKEEWKMSLEEDHCKKQQRKKAANIKDCSSITPKNLYLCNNLSKRRRWHTIQVQHHLNYHIHSRIPIRCCESRVNVVSWSTAEFLEWNEWYIAIVIVVRWWLCNYCIQEKPYQWHLNCHMIFKYQNVTETSWSQEKEWNWRVRQR